MGCSCCKKGEKFDPDSGYSPENYGTERLRINMGNTFIEVRKGHLHDVNAQYLVTVIDNYG